MLFDLLHKGRPGIIWHVTVSHGNDYSCASLKHMFVFHQGSTHVLLLQIHFRDFPSDTLLAWEGSQSLLQAYLNSLKEAAVICSGNAAAILQMTQQSQQSLWTSVEAADLPAYQRVVSSLQLTPKARGSRSATVPVRLQLRNGSGGEHYGLARQCLIFRPYYF